MRSPREYRGLAAKLEECPVKLGQLHIGLIAHIGSASISLVTGPMLNFGSENRFVFHRRALPALHRNIHSLHFLEIRIEE